MNTILKYYVRVIFLLFPIVFIPVVIDGFGFGKNLSLMILALLALVLWVIKLITTKEKVIKTNKMFWVFLIFVGWSVVTFFRLDSGVRMDSLMSPMGMGTVASLFILFFVWLQVNDKEENNKQFLFLTIAGLIVGVVSLIVFLLPASKLPLSIPKANPLISITADWSLTGSLLAEVTLLAFLIFGWLKKLMSKIKKKVEGMAYMTDAVMVAFFSLMFFLDIYKFFKLGWVMLDRYSSWVIAVESFKRNPIFGQGIGNFTQAFNLFRPTSFNLTQYWANIFNGSSMGFLQIWTELGIVGLLLMIYLVVMVLKLKKNIKFWQMALFLAVVLFLPLNLMSVFLLTWLLVGRVGGEVKETKLILNVGEKNFNVMPYLVALLVLVGVGFGGYWVSKMFLGDFYMRQSLVAASKNDGSSTYNLEIKAIGINSYVPSYRKIYSQTNLALTQAILSKQSISDDDKQKASVLVQQAVREAKAAISLDQKNPSYWYNLAGIYRSLIGLVDGSDSWSYQAYQQANILDPVNPIIDLDMGGLLYSAKNYDQADRMFQKAVESKNDYANAWYNWANSAKQMGNFDAAITRLQQTLKLISTTSDDYKTASAMLDSWQKEAAAAKSQQTTSADIGSTQVATQKESAVSPTPTAVVVPTEQVSPTPTVALPADNSGL